MRSIHILLIAIVVAAMLLAEMARAQSSMCGPYKEFVEVIEGSRYGESSAGRGLSGQGQVVVEIFVGKETFTILATTPATGRTCIIAAGKGWAATVPKIQGDDL